MKKVSINDIAKKAGYSKTTVSFAFNNPERLPEQTVKRILDTAEELGYSPDPIARSMSTGHTGTIGVLFPQSIPDVIRNPFIPEFLAGVGEICTREGFTLMLVPPLKGSIRRAIENAAVDGFITLGLEEYKATMVVLRQRGVPFITVDSDPIEDIPAVNIDDETGAKEAMLHVLEQGHRDIRILAIRSGREGHYEEYHGTLHYRMNGYLAALSEYGLELDRKHIRLIEGACTEYGGAESFRVIWKGRNRPTAIVAMSDIMAIGALNAAREMHIADEEISMVGFDDIPMAASVNPALTTVAQPHCKKGQLAAELLLNTINGEVDNTHYVLPTELVLRNSVFKVGE
ncbi:MAG: LacI family DNA-binding transcriptional regulator [Anaerolineaceae bacterium]|nr:LacI family DNA-binding transcriptional regulator [Anaerolineaceae bacterium]